VTYRMKRKRYWNESLGYLGYLLSKVPSVNPHAEPSSLGILVQRREGVSPQLL